MVVRTAAGGGQPPRPPPPPPTHTHTPFPMQDLDSPSLKTKKHWNSFTTPFFLDVDWVLEQLEVHGKLDYDLKEKEALLKGPMTCPGCGCILSSMPMVKQHVGACAALSAGP